MLRKTVSEHLEELCQGIIQNSDRVTELLKKLSET